MRLLAGVRKAISLPDLVAARYGSELTRLLMAVAILLGVMAYLGSQIKAMAIVAALRKGAIDRRRNEQAGQQDKSGGALNNGAVPSEYQAAHHNGNAGPDSPGCVTAMGLRPGSGPSRVPPQGHSRDVIAA